MNFGGALLVIAQVVLLALYYGDAILLGIAWSSLPWWIIWFPMLLGAASLVVCGMVVAVMWVLFNRKW